TDDSTYTGQGSHPGDEPPVVASKLAPIEAAKQHVGNTDPESTHDGNEKRDRKDDEHRVQIDLACNERRYDCQFAGEVQALPPAFDDFDALPELGAPAARFPNLVL